MRETLTLRAALANTGNPRASADLLEFLRENTSGLEFRNRETKPGQFMNDAFDWQAILGVTASTLAIAQALWAAYKKFIVPLRSNGKKNTFVVVQVQNQSRKSVHFSIGHEYTEEEEFVKAFVEKTETITIISTEDRN